MSYFDLVENGDYNSYAWGVDVFNSTIAACTNKFRTKPGYYRHGGFPLALQVWFYECCPGLNGRFADHKGSDIPRIMNWRIEKQLGHDFVCLLIFILRPDQVNNISPTDNEKVLLELDGLKFESGSGSSQSGDSVRTFFAHKFQRLMLEKKMALNNCDHSIV